MRRKGRTGRALAVPLAAALTGLGACRSARPSPPAPAAPSPAASSPAPATVPSPAPPVARPHNTLRWKTNDVSNLGYDIYRGDSEDGPFAKINALPVPGTLKPGKVQTFEYEDFTIDPAREYWYYVESISLMGERLKFTPTLKAPAKVPPPPSRD
jgi:hypothetical protein